MTASFMLNEKFLRLIALRYTAFKTIGFTLYYLRFLARPDHHRKNRLNSSDRRRNSSGLLIIYVVYAAGYTVLCDSGCFFVCPI